MTTISKISSPPPSLPVHIPNIFERAFIKLVAFFKRTAHVPSHSLESSPYVIDFGKLKQIEEENTLYETLVESSSTLTFYRNTLSRYHAELGQLKEEYLMVMVKPTEENLQREEKIHVQIDVLKLLISETDRKFRMELCLAAKAQDMKMPPVKKVIPPTDLKIRQQFTCLAKEIQTTAKAQGMETHEVAVLTLPLFAKPNDLANLQNAFQSLVK